MTEYQVDEKKLRKQNQKELTLEEIEKCYPDYNTLDKAEQKKIYRKCCCSKSFTYL